MKICLCTRSDWKTRPGGDLVQARKTADELTKLGVDVHFAGVPDEIPKDCDFLHLFNLTRISDTLAFSDFAVSNRMPYALSPIWHSLEAMSKFYSMLYKWLPLFSVVLYLALKEPLYYRDNIKVLFRSVFNWKNSVRSVVNRAEILLPNSPAELECLYKDLGLSNKRHIVVPNGVADSHNRGGEDFKKLIIVVPGRIEPRKNQISIISAFLHSRASENGYRLHFLGKKSSSHSHYVKEFDSLIKDDPRLEYFGELSFDNVQNCFSESQVVVLASFFETTGLVILEGIMNGCQAVMTHCSYNDYYYGDSVHYCDPFSIDSISKAIDSAVFSPLDFDDDRFVFFRWENAARETLSAYNAVLSDGSK